MMTIWTAVKQCDKPKADPCCVRECTSGTKNRYFTGKRLSPDALVVEQDYQVERRRLINRAMHGWGVVYGYPVWIADPAGSDKMTIGAGLAFDKPGRELVHTPELKLSLDELLELPSKLTTPGGADDCWMLRVHYAEQLSAPLSVKDPCNHERQQWDRVCETVRFSLERVDCASCCAAHACELKGDCATGPCCAAKNTAGGPRSGAHCRLCEHLTDLSPGAKCDGLGEFVDGVRVDQANGVELACIKLIKVCDKWKFKAVQDDCGPRRLVKRNDLLFDLIRGCDLTHISKISWPTWHRSHVKFADFAARFDKTYNPTPGGDLECVTRFTVAFSNPVRRATVTPDCFTMTMLAEEDEGGWHQPLRVPILRIADENEPSTNAELITQATLIVDWRWAGDAVHGSKTKFDSGPVRVEIEIHGDLILDCNGQAVDANARGLSPGPSGNGTPGGTFRSNFTVAKKDAPAYPRPAPSPNNGGTTS